MCETKEARKKQILNIIRKYDGRTHMVLAKNPNFEIFPKCGFRAPYSDP